MIGTARVSAQAMETEVNSNPGLMVNIGGGLATAHILSRKAYGYSRLMSKRRRKLDGQYIPCRKALDMDETVKATRIMSRMISEPCAKMVAE
ncbi:MAG: hypothetical protein ACLSAC_03820 [Enterocloster bolteae]